MDPGFDLLLQEEARVPYPVAHFYEVEDGEVRDRVAVGLARLLVGRQHLVPVVAVLVEQGVQHGAVLEPAVHALPVEGHDGVRGVADQRELVFVGPGITLHGHQRAGGVGEEVFGERRHQRHRVGEHPVEEGHHVVLRLQAGERLLALEGEEERAGEAAVEVGQGDEHVAAAGPDVQGVLLHAEAAALGRRDVEFLVGVVEVVLLVLEAVGGELHLQARGGEGAVGAEDEVGGHGTLLLRLRMLEAGGGRVQVDAGAALVEVDGRARLLGEGHQLAVEQAPAGGVDRLTLFAVALVAELALHRMQHAAVHGDGHLADRFLDAYALQAAPAAVGEREVDRLARGDVGLPHVGAAFVHGDLVAAADEVDGQEGADQSGTQQGDVLLCGHDAIGMAWSVSRRGRIPGADRSGTRLRRSYRAARGPRGSRRVRASRRSRRGPAGLRRPCGRSGARSSRVGSRAARDRRA